MTLHTIFAADLLLVLVLACYPASNPRRSHFASNTGLAQTLRQINSFATKANVGQNKKNKQKAATQLWIRRASTFFSSQVYGLDFGLGELASATICRVQSRATTADRHQPQPFLDKARQHSHSAMPSASQSSQQSFTMSQQSQTGRAASFNRGYNGGVDGPQIYSVCIPAICRRSASGREMACSPPFRAIGEPLTDVVCNRRRIRVSMCTRWK